MIPIVKSTVGFSPILVQESALFLQEVLKRVKKEENQNRNRGNQGL